MSRAGTIVALLIVGGCIAVLLMQRGTAQRLSSQLKQTEAQLAAAEANTAELQSKLARAEQERDKYQKDASEVHRLRGEIVSLRNGNKTLEQQLAQARAKPSPAAQAPAQAPTAAAPASFANYNEMGQFVGGLRAKAFGAGALTPQEQQYLQTLKPELEKLERSPADFASFQASLIQSATGISDQGKLEKIRQSIQRVYENAVSQGLDLPSRRPDDPAWVDQRFQLDRRGTRAVQSVLSETERAAFDKQFLGVMGVDLGLGVDKTLYPKSFLGQ